MLEGYLFEKMLMIIFSQMFIFDCLILVKEEKVFQP